VVHSSSRATSRAASRTNALTLLRETLQLPSDIKIELEPLEGGLTNENYIAHINQRKITVRVHAQGTENYTARSAESEALIALQNSGYVPRFLTYSASFEISLMEYIPGRIVSLEEMAEKHFIEKISHLLQSVHQMGVSVSQHFDPLAEVHRLYRLVKELKSIPNNYDQLLKAIDRDFKGRSEPQVLCHRDPFHRNFIYCEENEKLSLIDWEYAGMCSQNIDLATLFEINYLSEEAQKQYLMSYFETDSNLDELNRYKMLVNTYWSLWALLQHQHSRIDMDYLNYAQVHYEKTSKLVVT